MTEFRHHWMDTCPKRLTPMAEDNRGLRDGSMWQAHEGACGSKGKLDGGHVWAFVGSDISITGYDWHKCRLAVVWDQCLSCYRVRITVGPTHRGFAKPITAVADCARFYTVNPMRWGLEESIR